MLLVALPAHAQFQLNGDATQLSCKCYRLTQDLNNEAGSVWNTNKIALTEPFDMTFDVFLGCDDAGADGIAFVLQPISTSVGGGGGGLGYQGVSPSFALEFDTHPNGWDPADDHLAIMQNGTVDHSTADNLAGPVSMDPGGANTEDCGYHTARVTWDPASNTFEAYFDGNLRLSYSGDIVNNIFGGDSAVYWGFTGATGGRDNDQRFCISVISNFLIDNGVACLQDSVSFIDSSYSTVDEITDWEWDFGDGATSTDSTPDHQYSSTGTYDVELIVTSTNGCKDTLVKPVEVYEGPTAGFSGDTVCFGDTIAFTDSSTPGDTAIRYWGYSFGDGDTASIPSPDHSYSSSGTYPVRQVVQDSVGCRDTAKKTLFQPAELQVSIADTAHVSCYDSADGWARAQVNGGISPYSYSWDTSPVQNSKKADSLGPGTYIVTVTDQVGCVDKDTVSITEPPELLFSTFNVDSVDCHGLCDGKVSAFPSGGTVSGPYKFHWSGGIGGINEAQPDSICAGTYTLTIEDDSGCTIDTSFTMPEPEPFYVTTSSDSAHCNKADGRAMVDSVSGNTGGYSFQWDANASGQTGDTAQNLQPDPYDVTITDSKGCDTVATVDVPNIPGQDVSISSTSDASCFGGSDGSATAQVSGGKTPYSYQWNDPGAQSSPTASGLSAGSYKVVVEDSAGCLDSATANVGEPSPVQISSSSDTTICIGGAATLKASASGGTPGYSYHWNKGLGSGQTKVVTPGSNTSYQVYAEDASGCRSDSILVNVQLHPALSVDAFSDDSICPGGSKSLSAIASGGKGSGYSYSWSNGDSGPTTMVAPSSTTTYEVSVEDGCSTPSASDSVEIVLHELPDVKFSGADLEGCRPVKASFTNETDPSEIGGDCIWSFGNGGQAVGCSQAEQRFEEPGCYDVSLRLRSKDGCVDSSRKKDMVCVRPYPNAKFQMEPESTSVQDPEVKFTNLSTGEVEWQWDFADLDSSSARHPSYSFPNESEGSYDVCLRVRNSYDCVDSTCQEVRIQGDFVLYVPNAFTPDGDGVNDAFKPVVQGYDGNEYRFMIFDRWGEKIFETDDPEKGWDGDVKGNGARRSDVYIWKLITKDHYTGEDVKRTGHVTLIR